ncbi:hypothetical protein F3Y22_tig00112289pilonHSYRG00159 [Hibiscus syriacus]|uniref:Uncharacterized protein n=1 Tax=Hibiscus syriacus TaxID=106335 RepID=A0A6A2X288_HIBSY|nr:hypothetical protein F3Y22_tig00112289pilonHSYRG00159 [Hibiscus syriacus]
MAITLYQNGLGLFSCLVQWAAWFAARFHTSSLATPDAITSSSGVIPAAHAVSLHWGHPHIFVALGYEVVMAVLYAAGAAFYTSSDIAGHSHQIFHVFVVLAALVHSVATLVIMDFRRESVTCAY